MKMMNTYFPVLPETIKRQGESILDRLCKINPLFDFPSGTSESFELYLASMQKLVRRVLPKSFIDSAKKIHSLEEREKIRQLFKEFDSSIPNAFWSLEDPSPSGSISIVTICEADYTEGVGRFLGDVYSRWLVPGKQFPLVMMHSMAFAFQANPGKGYFIFEIFVKVDNQKDLGLIKSNLPGLANEISLNILAVQHARRVISLKPLTIEQKKIIIQENISSLLNRPAKDLNHNLFDEMQQFFIKTTAEQKVTRIKEQISPLLEFRPQVYERDIFSELQNYVFLFKDLFTAERDLKHLTRIIAYKYLFRKIITNLVLSNPHQRHLNIKLIQARLDESGKHKRILGVLIGINMLRENEIIGEKHVLKAIQSIVPDATFVPNSALTDKRANNNVKTIYLEVVADGRRFTSEEIKELRLRLAKEIKTRIESVINPIFMPRNEEEVLRNILVLSNQLKYVQDIPQVIITFHKQTETKISFTVILLRVLKPDDLPLQKLFSKRKGRVKFSDHEIKAVGLLRRRYQKEANVFEMHLNKKYFLRKDFSVDLNEARRAVYNTLVEMFGEVRDYNGGMISKQSEVLNELKKLLLQINFRNDFLLENFFYAISPNYMQSLIQPHILKKLFLLVMEALEHDYSVQLYFLKTQIVDDHFLLTIGAINPSLKDFLEQRIESLEFDISCLSSSYINTYDICCLSYILRFTDSDQHQQFLQLVIESVKVWKDTMTSQISSDFFPELTTKSWS